MNLLETINILLIINLCGWIIAVFTLLVYVFLKNTAAQIKDEITSIKNEISELKNNVGVYKDVKHFIQGENLTLKEVIMTNDRSAMKTLREMWLSNQKK